MQSPRPPLFVILFTSIFGFIGLTLLIFIWVGDSGPLFFRIIGSFIALAFVVLGFGAPISMLKQRRAHHDSAPPQHAAAGYKCPNCGAGLGKEEASPSGDVKCSYCNRWYNIHAQRV
jgi:hypothetical protein